MTSATTTTFGEALRAVAGGARLSEDEAYAAVSAIFAGEVAEVPMAAFLTALRVRGETTDELVGAARAMRDKVVPVEHGLARVLDTCGTGGDGSGTFNISTTVAFVAAAAGVAVGKHGNRAVSSSVGSADVLEALGLKLEQTPVAIARSMRELGFGFMFAPLHHAAMRHAAPVRKQLGFRTLFNLLGPVTNPARATHQLLGLFDGARLAQIAQVLARLGVARALVVHGPGGMDELGLSGPSRAVLVEGGALSELTIDPVELGLARAPTAALGGGDAATNAAIVRKVLAGERGPAHDVVALNAGAALWVAGAADSLGDGVRLAGDVLTRGAAHERLLAIAARTHEPPEPREPYDTSDAREVTP